jgi:hypothetical protein
MPDRAVASFSDWKTIKSPRVEFVPYHLELSYQQDWNFGFRDLPKHSCAQLDESVFCRLQLHSRIATARWCSFTPRLLLITQPIPSMCKCQVRLVSDTGACDRFHTIAPVGDQPRWTKQRWRETAFYSIKPAMVAWKPKWSTGKEGDRCVVACCVVMLTAFKVMQNKCSE